MRTEERTATSVRLLHGIFELQAGRTPRAIALEVPPRRAGGSRERVTYADLNGRADQLAARLAPWVKRECVVAVLLPRAGAGLWAAQLAILKAGGAWTCIEPDTPVERLRFLLEDSRAVAVVAADGLRPAPDRPAHGPWPRRAPNGWGPARSPTSSTRRARPAGPRA